MVVLWDRDCGFCAFTLSLLLRADTRRVLRPAFIQGPEGDRLLAGMPPRQRLESWHAVEDDGRVTSGGAALTRVLAELPAGRALGRLTGALPGVTDSAYRWVANHRSLLSKPIPARAKDWARRDLDRRSS